MRKIFYCTECGFIGSDEEGNQPICPECGATLFSTNYSLEYWKGLSPKEKHQVRNQLFGIASESDTKETPIPERASTSKVNYIYFCKNCNDLEIADKPRIDLLCEECGRYRIPLEITENEWDDLSNDDKRTMLTNAIAGARQEKPIQRQRAAQVDDIEFFDVNGASSKNRIHSSINRKDVSNPRMYSTNNTRSGGYEPKDKAQTDVMQFSTISIIGLVISWVPCFGIVGAILAIIDLAKYKTKHTLSIIALCVFMLSTVITGVGMSDDDSNKADKTEQVKAVAETSTPTPTSTPTRENTDTLTPTVTPIIIPNVEELEYKRIDDIKADEFYKAQTIDKQGDNLKGKTVLTYGRIYSDASKNGYLQISVPGTVHGIDCYLAKDTNCSLSDLTEDDTAVIVGTISGSTDALFFKQVQMTDCYVIGTVSTAQYGSASLDKIISKIDDDFERLCSRIGYSTDGISIDTSDSVASDSSSDSGSSGSLFGTYDVDTENAIETTAKTVYKEMKENQVACKSKFNGKTVKMKGIVDDIGTNVFGQEYVTFETGDPYSFEGVQIFFKNDQMDYVASLKKGDTITVYGVANIGSMTFKMGNCFPANE